MTTKVLVLLLALGFLPIAASAQTMPPPAPAETAAPAAPPAMNPGGPMHLTPAQRREMMTNLRRFREQAERIRRTTRARMLAALSAAHRALLARLVGDLAVSSSPNPRAVAHELDAALYASERSAILAASRAQMAQMRALGDEMRAQVESTMPHPANGHGKRMWVQRGMMMRHHHTPDAGEILLRTATMGGGAPRVFFMMHTDRGAPPPQQP